jgi:hypothetical protein
VRIFLLDLWLDLREKRLAPVALALLAGVIAVPLFLAKGSEEPPAPPPATTSAKAPLEPVVSAPEDKTVASRLEVFDPKDPFAPPASAVTAAPSTGSTGTTGGTTSTGTTSTGTGTTGGTTGTTGGGTTGTTGGGTTTGTTQTITRRVVTFTTALRFGQTGEEKTYKDVHRLDLIPSQDDPLVVFLGVTTSGKTAVFLVSSDLTTSGEGTCKPSRDECTFLYLRDDADHDTASFTASDGTTYRLRLTDIAQVAVESAVQQERQGQSGSGDRSPAFTGSASPPGEPVSEEQAQKRPFFGPVFSDNTSETSTDGE